MNGVVSRGRQVNQKNRAYITLYPLFAEYTRLFALDRRGYPVALQSPYSNPVRHRLHPANALQAGRLHLFKLALHRVSIGADHRLKWRDIFLATGSQTLPEDSAPCAQQVRIEVVPLVVAKTSCIAWLLPRA